MSRILIDIPNNSDLPLLIALAERLNANIIEVTEDKKNITKSPIYWLEKLASQGGVKSIPNPSKWQKEIRKDKKLSRK